MSNRIFHDMALESEFQAKGYVKVPLLNAEETALIDQEIAMVQAEDALRLRTPFYVSIFDDNLQAKRRYHELFIEKLVPRFRNILYQHRFTVGNVFYKFPGGGQLDVHDHVDRTDESKFTSVSVWMPLHDTNLGNGTLEVLEGSHKLFPFITHWNEPYYFQQFAEQLKNGYLTPTNARAGEAVIFCDKLIHYSGANQTDVTRRAVQFHFLPESAPFLFYHHASDVEEKCFEVYEANQEFYIDNPCHVPILQARPTRLKLVGQVPYRNRFITEEEFCQRRNEGDSIRSAFYKPRHFPLEQIRAVFKV